MPRKSCLNVRFQLPKKTTTTKRVWILLTFSLHVVHRVSNNFIRVIQGSLPSQKDSRARHSVGSNVPGRAWPVLWHYHDEPRHSEDWSLLILCLALIDGVILRDDLVDDQFAGNTQRYRVWTQMISGANFEETNKISIGTFINIFHFKVKLVNKNFQISSHDHLGSQ